MSAPAHGIGESLQYFSSVDSLNEYPFPNFHFDILIALFRIVIKPTLPKLVRSRV